MHTNCWICGNALSADDIPEVYVNAILEVCE
mgnify:CR=1 FL=1